MNDDTIDYGLRPLWDSLLDIYREFRAVCNQYGLRHWVAFGTALGAVRHHGFIPWDDDFDVMMPRKDYETFMRIAQSELPSYLRVINWKNTNGYKWLFGKVQDTRKDRLNMLEVKLGRVLPQGVYIDVFACDGYPASKISRMLHTLNGIMICARREYCLCPINKRSRSRRKIMIIIGALLGARFKNIQNLRGFVQLNENRVRSYDYETSGCVITSGVRYSLGLKGTVYPRNIFSSGTLELAFENITVPILGEWGKYLEIEFGDWRALPPVEQRGLTHRNEEIAPWR